MGDARRVESKDSEHMVRECTAIVEEESWSSSTQVKEQVQKINQGGWKRPKRGVKREEWEARLDFADNEVMFRKMFFCFLKNEGLEWSLNLRRLKELS